MDLLNSKGKLIHGPLDTPATVLRYERSQQQRQQQQVQVSDEELFREMCNSLLGDDSSVAGDHHADITGPNLFSSSPTPSDEPLLTRWLTSPPWQNGPLLLSNTQPAVAIKEEAPLRATKHVPAACKKLEEAASAKRSQRQIAIKLAEAEKRLQGLAQRHREAQAENVRLKSHNKHVTACVGQAELQQRLSSIVAHSPLSPLPLPASCSQVSFSELPPSSCWDAAWVARIKGLTPQDFLVLRRQWIQQSAMLLTGATLYGPGSEAYCKLENLHDKQMELVQALVALCPCVWLESSQYDMDTLRPITVPSAEWVRDMFARLCPPQALGGLVAVASQFRASTAALHDEYSTLLRRCDALAAALDLQQAQAGPGGAQPGRYLGRGQHFDFDFRARSCHQSLLDRLRLDCSPGYVQALEQLDDTAKLLQANTSKQKAAMLRFFHTFCLDFHPRRISFVLMMYPLASTSVDFVPGMLLLGDAARPAPSTLGPPS